MEIAEMRERHRQRAAKVVESFRESLSESALQQVSEAELDELRLMIEEAISDELHNAAEMVEEVAKALRSLSNIPELGI